MTGATSLDVLDPKTPPSPPAAGWSSPHPINVRLSLPLGSRRYYLTLVGGRERRGPERRAEDRQRYPLRTAANMAFFLVLAVAIYLGGMFALAVQTSVIEF